MLVQFRLKNYGPFNDEAIFDLRAIKSYKEHPYNVIYENENTSLLKVAAIYGANASGKSNFVDAYRCFKEIIRKSFSQKNKDDNDKESTLEQNYNPYLFANKNSASEGTEFEAVYHYDNYEYKYGYIYNSRRIMYEWLYRRSLESNRQTRIFERSPTSIELGASIKQSCEKYIGNIDDDVLALSFYSSLKLKTNVFKEAAFCVYDILPLKMTCDHSIKAYLDLYFEDGFDEDEKNNLLRFLNAIDICINDVYIQEGTDNNTVYTNHLGKDGGIYSLPLNKESDGTRKAIAVYSLVRIALRKNKGLIIDELNMQLHPLLLKYIVDLFYNENSAAQLIYTTHDTTLLDRRYMRRDQIWFTNKNEFGESTLYSLAEFKIRKDQSFEKEYLGGVYGGIPILEDYNFLEK